MVFVASEDFTVIGGTLGEYHSMKICRLQDMAIKMKAPLICINDSGGARIEEGISSLSGYSGMFLRHTKASGVIPQIAVILGPCSGGACYAPAICDFIFMQYYSTWDAAVWFSFIRSEIYFAVFFIRTDYQHCNRNLVFKGRNRGRKAYWLCLDFVCDHVFGTWKNKKRRNRKEGMIWQRCN